MWCTQSIHGGNEEIRLNSDPWEMAEFTNWAKNVGKYNKIQCRKYILFRGIEEIFQNKFVAPFPPPPHLIMCFIAKSNSQWKIEAVYLELESVLTPLFTGFVYWLVN